MGEKEKKRVGEGNGECGIKKEELGIRNEELNGGDVKQAPL